MKIRTAYVSGGATAVAAAIFFGVAWLAHEGDAPARVKNDDNLFSFVRPMDGVRAPEDEAKVVQANAVKDKPLVIDIDLRLLFDHFLTEREEKGFNEVRTAIEREIDKQLRPGPAAEAKRLLARYLNYQLELAERDWSPQLARGTMEAMRAQLEEIRQTRTIYFSVKEAQGLFDKDDPHGPNALARLEVYQDPFLTDAQKAEKIVALDASAHETREAPSDVDDQEVSGNKVQWPAPEYQNSAVGWMPGKSNR